MKKTLFVFLVVLALCAIATVASAQYYPPYGGGYNPVAATVAANQALLYSIAGGQSYPGYPGMGYGQPMVAGVSDPCTAYYSAMTQSSQGNGVWRPLGDGVAVGVAVDGIRREDPAKVAGAIVYGTERITGAIQRRRQLGGLKKACQAFQAEQAAAVRAEREALVAEQADQTGEREAGPRSLSLAASSWPDVKPATGEQSPVIRPVPESRVQKVTEGGFCVVNSTKFWVELYDGDKFLGRLAAGQTLEVPAPEKGYRGLALIPNTTGGIGKGKVVIVATDNGWEFVPPKFDK
jgi:hypothetical protein